jgi:uncharacterized protein (DUF433 family)
MKSKARGRYIVADPKICHGQLTFRGTRNLVDGVLDLVAEGMDWDDTIKECHGNISREAIAEAVRLAGRAFRDHAGGDPESAVAQYRPNAESEGSTSMNRPDRADLLAAIAALCERYPHWRLGQLIANVAGWADQAVWDVDDQQLLAAARSHIDQLSPREPAPIGRTNG